jgi:hypothetical protein
MATKALGDLQRSLARGQKIQQQISGGKLLTGRRTRRPAR